MSDMATQKLVTDLKVLAGDMQELVKVTADQSGDKIVAARERARGALAGMQGRLAVLEASAMDGAKAAARATDDYVHAKPWAAIGAAGALAFVLGLLIGRR